MEDQQYGDFSVNGAQAFCIDHDKKTPSTGTSAIEELYNNDNIAKCLYYGWGGDRQWSGFTSRNMGIVYTSLALDYFNNGKQHKVAQDYIDYINSVSMPEIVLNFSNNNLTAYLTENKTEQRTQSISVSGDSSYYLTLNLQSGVTLVNETRGTESTGAVNVYGGDTFYLKAPLTINGRWTSEDIRNCKYKYQSIVYRTKEETSQDVAGKLKVIEDPTTTTNISVDWLQTGTLIVHKIDVDTNANISNTAFDVFDSNNNFIDTITTGEDGIARLDDVKIGTYKLIEKFTNEYYNIDATPITVSINSGNNEITVTNEKKKRIYRDQ